VLMGVWLSTTLFMGAGLVTLTMAHVSRVTGIMALQTPASYCHRVCLFWMTGAVSLLCLFSIDHCSPVHITSHTWY